MNRELRLHVVSLCAVFLALGIGILIGTTFVGNRIVDAWLRSWRLWLLR